MWELGDWHHIFLIQWLDTANTKKDIATRKNEIVRRVYIAPGLFGSGAYFLHLRL